MTGRRILLIGATGVFGARLARHLALVAGLDLVVASRDAAKARALAASLPRGDGTTVAGVGLDTRRGLAAQLADLAPWLVIDASGPFQGAGYEVPRAALEAGAHVVDLADARDYLAGYGAALDALARERGLVALAGASSTPALSAAALAELTTGWRRIDNVHIAIAPGGRSEVGPAVIAAILTYAGRPVPVWREGEPQRATGWLDGRTLAMPRLRRQRVAAVETADAQSLGPALAVTSRVAFYAGLESLIERMGLTVLARLRRAGLVDRLDGLIPLLVAARRLTRITTSDRGGMLVAVTGLDPEGELRHARWSLLAEQGHGPQVPTLATAAAVRAIAAGLLAPGARSAAGALPLVDIEAEMAPYALSTGVGSEPNGPAVVERALGARAFAALPEPLKAFHRADGWPVWRGRVRVEAGPSPVARAIRWMVGLPEAADDRPITVSVERSMSGGRPVEVWTRNVAGQRFSSRMSGGGEGLIVERFGPLSIALRLEAADGGVAMAVAGARLFGVPLPQGLRPRCAAGERADEAGRFRFDVALTLPVFGLLVRYAGWLAPAKGERGRDGPS